MANGTNDACLFKSKLTRLMESSLKENIHPGALVSASDKNGKPMLELKQEDKLRLQADIPEAIAINLNINDTVSFYLSALPGKKMIANIARKSSNINAQYRSERIEMDVMNKRWKTFSRHVCKCDAVFKRKCGSIDSSSFYCYYFYRKKICDCNKRW